jgi:type I restriction enzyme M protein
MKENPLSYAHLEDFVSVYTLDNRRARKETDRFKQFTYDELIARDKASLDIVWLRDESLEDVENLPAPAVIAAEIVEDLEAALAEFGLIAETLAEPEEAIE